ncbi:hypothetical protein GKIL_4249 [Gloeobacter kilaueensis JS1]|uniref:Uncharacterized protein n=1 Tax=Gloeobacter kilaueensis (strain ATCC BAA-2537 / CCAP 1431/1 / ULC 316 / JS1) TaxID=1183438 RepID=U5QS22_GLOK1|nr:hypothetical protein GKIL_4249 [Gloeobacter kilaueensis JS1]
MFLSKIAAIARTHLQLRLRQPGTVFLFFLLPVLAYSLIPDRSSGMTLMQVDGQRLIYNSATLSLATALLSAVIVSLWGFYLVFGALQREVESHTDSTIAATPMTNAQYVLGAILGSGSFLWLLALGLFLSIVGMHWLRGEAAFEPVVYITTYLVILLPVLLFVPVAAFAFEATVLLAGRLGSFIYFGCWLLLVSLPVAEFVIGGSLSWTRLIDVSGMGWAVEQLSLITAGRNYSIGLVTYQPGLPSFIFPGLHFEPAQVLLRFATLAVIVPLAWMGYFLFDRFDPTKRKSRLPQPGFKKAGGVSTKENPQWLSLCFGRLAGLPWLLRVVIADCLLTWAMRPKVVALCFAVSALSCLAPPEYLQRFALPCLFLILVLLLADVPVREKLAGTGALIAVVPNLPDRWVVWKWSTCVFLALSFFALPGCRILFSNPSAALSLAIGLLLVTAAAVALGTWTGGPTTFIALAIPLLYLIFNDGGRTGWLDFAGWYGVATPVVQTGYAALSAVLLFIAQAGHALKRRRNLCQ